MDIEFSEIPKSLVESSDVSNYVGGVKKVVNNYFVIIKNFINEVYYTFLMNKIIIVVANKFIQNVYK